MTPRLRLLALIASIAVWCGDHGPCIAHDLGASALVHNLSPFSKNVAIRDGAVDDYGCVRVFPNKFYEIAYVHFSAVGNGHIGANEHWPDRLPGIDGFDRYTFRISNKNVHLGGEFIGWGLPRVFECCCNADFASTDGCRHAFKRHLSS